MRPSIRSLATLALFVGLAGASEAQELPSRWIADSKSGCKTWDPTPMPDESITWSGRCVGGYTDGHGTLTWFVRGALFETDTADFARGKLNGHGSLDFANGQKFDGQFHDQKPNGAGTLRTFDGQIFSGQWTEGCLFKGKLSLHFNVAPDDCNFSS